MKIFLKNLSAWLSHKEHMDNASIQKAALLNLAITTIVLFFLFAYGVLFYLLCGMHEVMIGYVVSFFLAFGTIPIFRRSSHLRGSINYLIGVSLFSLVYATFYTGGIRSYALIWLVAVPNIGGNLLAKFDKIFWAAFTFLIFFAFYICSCQNINFDDVVPEFFRVTYLFLTLTSTLIGSLACILVFDRDIELLLKKLIENEKRIHTLFRTVMHDLANPLSIISGAIHILSNPKLKDEDKTKWWNTLKNNISRMENILLKIDEIEKLRRGKMQIKILPIPLNPAILSAIEYIQDKMKEKNITLQFDSKYSENILVMADQITLTNQIVTNILTNAIKFSPTNGLIKINTIKQNKYICLTIEDQGVGISEESLDLFRKNGEINSSPGTLGEKGHGFGLAIIKSFAETYGGWIDIESTHMEKNRECHGTKFQVFLKVAKK